MYSEVEISILISLVMIFTLSLGISIIILSRKNKKIRILGTKLLKEELEKKELEKVGIAITTQESERTEIARKLHDEVSALLSLVQLNLSIVHQEAQNGNVDIESLEKSTKMLDLGIEQLRSITKGLVPHYLVKFGLAKALEKTIHQKMEQLTAKHTFNSQLAIDIHIEEQTMIQFYYIAHELITNLLKHSRPSDVKMSLSNEEDILKLEIIHDGLALEQKDFEKFALDSDSLGIMNIKYRLNIIKGELIFTRIKSEGIINLSTNLFKNN
jgi:signal transduction histidine kinase